MQLNNEVALITGASRGIGQSILLELGKQGATVIGTATSEAGAEKISAFINENELYINIKNQNQHMSIFNLALQGKHNLYNSMAAGIASRLLDIRKEVVRESFSDFKNIEHHIFCTTVSIFCNNTAVLIF